MFTYTSTKSAASYNGKSTQIWNNQIDIAPAGPIPIEISRIINSNSTTNESSFQSSVQSGESKNNWRSAKPNFDDRRNGYNVIGFAGKWKFYGNMLPLLRCATCPFGCCFRFRFVGWIVLWANIDEHWDLGWINQLRRETMNELLLCQSKDKQSYYFNWLVSKNPKVFAIIETIFRW